MPLFQNSYLALFPVKTAGIGVMLITISDSFRLHRNEFVWFQFMACLVALDYIIYLCTVNISQQINDNCYVYTESFTLENV